MKISTQHKAARQRGKESTVSPALRALLLEQGYSELCLPGGELCGLHRFNFTTGLVVGVRPGSYVRRCCYVTNQTIRYATSVLRDIAPEGGPSVMVGIHSSF